MVPYSEHQGNGRQAPTSSVEDALAAIRRGEIVIVADDPGRENEGDFVMAAERVTPDAINFMVTHGRGIVCLPVTRERAVELGFTPMVPDQIDDRGCAFTVSVDLRHPPNTGTSTFDRAACIARVVSPDARPHDFRAPGHVFPLAARSGGVLERPGHTEAAVDLARLAGLAPAGVICEILNADGSMARMDDLRRLAETHGLHLITVADLIAYRLRRETLVRRLAEARIPTSSGTFTSIAYGSQIDSLEHVAMVLGDPRDATGLLVRVHSECLTGDAFDSLRCDCAAQLRQALAAIAAEGRGVLVYLRGHEGRGIGLVDKLRAYELQDNGDDTVEANLRLGHQPDVRSYDTGAQILRDLGVASVRLLTNNPAKRTALEQHGIPVLDRIPLEVPPTDETVRYLEAKRDRLGHELSLSLEMLDPA